MGVHVTFSHIFNNFKVIIYNCTKQQSPKTLKILLFLVFRVIFEQIESRIRPPNFYSIAFIQESLELNITLDYRRNMIYLFMLYMTNAFSKSKRCALHKMIVHHTFSTWPPVVDVRKKRFRMF